MKIGQFLTDNLPFFSKNVYSQIQPFIETARYFNTAHTYNNNNNKSNNENDLTMGASLSLQSKL